MPLGIIMKKGGTQPPLETSQESFAGNYFGAENFELSMGELIITSV